MKNFDFDFLDDYTPKRRKYTKRKTIRKRNTYRKSKRSWDNDIELIMKLSFLISIFWYMTYFLFIKPNIESIKYYWTIVWVVWIILLFIFLIYLYNKRKKYKLLEEERLSHIPDFIRDLENKISLYKPLRYHSKEEPYQMELAWFLRSHFKTLDIEVSKNDSRPDIVIDNVAIEIKWPTNKWELRTIPDKIIRYLKDWDYLFIVLFKVEVDRDYYEEWVRDIYNTFENKRDKIFIIDL